MFNKKIKFFSRNKKKLNISPINKTEIRKNTLNAKHKRIKSENNVFKNSISKIKKSSKNKEYIISTEDNKTRKMNIFITESSMNHKNRNRKKELFKSLSSLNEKTKKIKELIKENTPNKYSDGEKNKKEAINFDKNLFKLLLDRKNSKKSNPQTIKNIFRQIKKKNYFSDLIRQYSSYREKLFHSPNRKKFLKELLKMGIIEKKETFLNNYQYKNNYIIKDGINQLKEKQNSKIRKLFNKKVIKMKNLNIINIESFHKNMNNSKIK